MTRYIIYDNMDNVRTKADFKARLFKYIVKTVLNYVLAMSVIPFAGGLCWAVNHFFVTDYTVNTLFAISGLLYLGLFLFVSMFGLIWLSGEVNDAKHKYQKALDYYGRG